MAKLIDRYAHALLELSEEKGNMEKDLEQAVLIRDSLMSADVQAFLQHPYISNTEKHQLFNNAFSQKLATHWMGFLYLMVQKKREVWIVPVLTEFIDRASRRLGRIEANVVSAKPLTKQQIESIRMLLSKKTQMQVEINATVDSAVIGGLYILVDGKIFDRTVRTELNTMKERLRGTYE